MSKQYSEEEVLELFKTALWEVDRKKLEKVDVNTRFFDLGLDSVVMFEIVGYLEDKLEVLFPDERLNDIHTLSDLHRILNEVSLLSERRRK